MKKDIDTILRDSALELTLGGKTYVIEDINIDAFLRFMKQQEKKPEEREDARRQLEVAMGLKSGELDGVGLRAATIAFETINEWLRSSGKEDDTSVENPPPST